MHCHSAPVWSDPLVPTAVLAASLLGSGHCALMCGGLVTAAARSRVDRIFYHAGRLAGYVVLGAASGWVGARTVVRFPEEVSLTVAWAIAASFVWMGVSGWKRGTWHFSVPGSGVLNGWISRFVGSGARGAWYAGAVGGLSILLPCGWLYGFVLASLSTADPLKGAVLMSAFWAGTLPALAVSRWVMDLAASIAGRFAPRLSSVLLVAAGIAPILARYWPAR